LGFGAQGLIWSDDGQDNLYKVSIPYQYTTTEILYDNVQKRDVRRIHRVFNRFHLLVSEETRQNDNVLLLENSYYADQSPNLSFDQQPAQCQLVTEVRKTWYLRSSSANKRVETTLTEFDAYGNLLVQTLPTGIREISSYYPKEGGDGCPEDPDGFVRTLKEKRVEPASTRHDLRLRDTRTHCVVAGLQTAFAKSRKAKRDFGVPAPTLLSVYRYSEKPTLGSTLSKWLALDSETLLQVAEKVDVKDQKDVELQRTETQYIDDVSEPFLFGRIRRESQTLNGETSHTDYSYVNTIQKRGAEQVQKTTKTLSTAFSNPDLNATKTVTLEHSLLTGLPLLDQDENDVEINYRYDALGRVVEEIVSPGTSYEARRLYTYTLCSQPGDKALQSAMDVNDVTTHTELDGLGRAIAEYHQNIYQPAPELPKAQTKTANDGTVPTDQAMRRRAIAEYHQKIYQSVPDFLKVQAWKYNAYGQLEQETSWDHWQPDQGQTLQTLELTSTYAYNDWGAVTRITRPDAVVDVSEFDPITLKRTHWQETETTLSLWSETVSNGFDKPLSVRQKTGEHYLEQTYAYDGLGRCVESTDPMDHTSGFEYDAWGRLLHTHLPDMTVVSKTYAPHTREALPISVRIVPDNEALPSVLAGERLFDGLNRQVQLKVGPRTSTYGYNGSQMNVSEYVTPAGERLQYSYELGLTSLPQTCTTSDEDATFSYDFKTAQLTATRSKQGVHAFKYDLAGNLSSESWTDINRLAGRATDSGKAEPFSVTYNNSLRGRQISRIDVSGLQTRYEQDAQGRVKSIFQGQLQAEFSYAAQGWLSSTTCTDLGSGEQIHTALEHDDLGREILRTLSIDGQVPRSIEQHYQADSKLMARTLREGDVTLQAETFSYDLRGRLKVYTCAEPAASSPAETIARQDFSFDTLDNITALSTTYADGRTDKTTYHFNPADPCQLTEIRYDDPKKPAVQLVYDDNGHLTRDEHDQQLAYDSQGRLLSVADKVGQIKARYRYDGHNQLMAVTHGQQPESLRFYQEGQLTNTLQAGTAISYLRESGRPLGQQTPGDDSQTLLLMTDPKYSVIGECQQKTTRHVTYDPYGEPHGDEPLQSLLAFNGEVRDAVSGWYLLGKGYRAYNPTLMRFHSPDSLSPFGAGGVNPYVYCLSDPINAVDPSGHSLKSWIGVTLGLIGIAATVVTAGGMTPVAGGLVAWGLWGAGVGTGVASGVTGIMGSMDEDRQHARTLDNVSIITGVVSMLFSAFSAAANFSKTGKLHGFVGSAKEGADDAAGGASRGSFGLEDWDVLPEKFEAKATTYRIPRPELTLPHSSRRSSVRSATSISSDEFAPLTPPGGVKTPEKVAQTIPKTGISSTQTETNTAVVGTQTETVEFGHASTQTAIDVDTPVPKPAPAVPVKQSIPEKDRFWPYQTSDKIVNGSKTIDRARNIRRGPQS
ncbi:RHS repeat-associated core domain-containing protein, partial [Pseudomonas sp. NFACC02]|uniref:RHS repeat-associated core domain-containing protein n=1 Tax=Pseudomonas sp. NFACC02 TaxID=1566250 RepID=UPI0008BEEC32